jgi:hypothetical protein
MNPCSFIVGHFLQCFGSQLGIGMEFWYFTVVSAEADVALKSMLHDGIMHGRWHLQVSGAVIVLSWSSNSEKCLCEWWWPTVGVAANDGHWHWSVPKHFLNSSVVLLWQVGWIDCLVLAYLGDFLNLDLVFLCLMHLILFFGMANLKSSSAE